MGMPLISAIIASRPTVLGRRRRHQHWQNGIRVSAQRVSAVVSRSSGTSGLLALSRAVVPAV
eukprot:1916390-Alexandrium_andersonii.AAC.1